MTLHELKTWPAAFNPIVAGEKRHEVRSNSDRRFEVGDVLVLREWKPEDYRIDGPNDLFFSPDGAYTGRQTIRIVTYITRGGDFGLPLGVDVLSVRPFWNDEMVGDIIGPVTSTVLAKAIAEVFKSRGLNLDILEALLAGGSQ